MGRAQRLWIEGPAGRLEAALRLAAPARAAVLLAHPHPLHGGTLDHPVLFHADRELNRAGSLTLRFNFRAVGTSEGRHDAGRGELDDLRDVARWLRGLDPSLPLVLVGFSFGAWCAVRHAVEDGEVAGLIALGLPLRLYSFEALERFRRPFAVVQAEHDEFGSPAEIEALARRAVPAGRVWVVPGAEHRLDGQAPAAAAAVLEAAEWILKR